MMKRSLFSVFGLRSSVLGPRSSVFVLVTAVCLLPSAVRSQDTTLARGVRIGLTYAPGTRPGVFIAPVSGLNADSVRTMLARDLDFGDRVTVIPADSGSALTGTLNYQVYAAAGAAAVVQASVTPQGSLHIVVHDVGGARVMAVWDVPLPGPALGGAWRLAVHRGSDEVERVVTGEKGISATRAMFEHEGSLWVVDADGAQAHLVSGTEGGLSPAWHPSGKYVAYDQLANTGHQTIIVKDLTGAAPSRTFATRHTLNITPAFSPDGNTLVFASGDDGTDIYSVAPFGNGSPTRLSVGQGSITNVGPTFSPDGRQIAFTSGRLGHAEVYIMDTDGTNPDLLTTMAFGDQPYRSDPDWSPDGRRVAFQSQISGVFQIMAINLKDRSVQGLTSEGRNVEPSWAPDGRHLLFTSTRSGTRQLWVLDTESGRTRQLTRMGNAREGAWSPRLELGH
jgi:TolB protein